MGAIIDEKKQKEIIGEIMEIFKKHDLTPKEIFFFSQDFYNEVRNSFVRERQKDTAAGLVNGMLKKFGLGGV